MADQRLKDLLRCILKTCEEELDSAAIWDQQMCHVAEMVLKGEPINPALQLYLDNSPDCREEFFALVAMMREENSANNETT